jgi:pimeloyl-ACP methyl ester carboxylesterase
MEYEQRYAKERNARLATQARDETLKDVRRLIALPEKIKPATRQFTKSPLLLAGKLTYNKELFITEEGVSVPGVYFHVLGRRGPRAMAIYVNGLGKTADLDRIEKLVKDGLDVLAVDLRGMGETSPGVPNAKPGYFGFDYQASFLGLHLNRPLLGQRVHDLLSILAVYHSNRPAIHVVGVGTGGPIALHAAALDPRIEAVTLEQSVLSWAAVVRSPISHNQLTNVVPGVLKAYDLPDLAALIAPRPLGIHAVDARGEAVTQAAIEEAYSPARKAYGKSGKLVLQAELK